MSRSSCSSTRPIAPAISCRSAARSWAWASSTRGPTPWNRAPQIRAAIEDALHFYPPDRIFLNPDCGFGTFSSRPMNTWETAAAKVAAMVAAAHDLRG